MQPDITVLMPNYNNAPFLAEAINSILNQTYKNFILLIVDDGSTDNSIEIIKNISDQRIQLIQKKSNSGIVDTLNIGLDNASTKYAIRMDGDDISTSNRFEILHSFMENHPEIGVCGSDIQAFGDTNDVWKYKTNKDEIKASLVYNAGVGHASCIYRMEVFKKKQIQYSNDHPYMEDYDLFSKLKKHTEFANIPQPLYKYRILQHNSTIKNRDTLFDRYRNMYANVLIELGIEPSEKNIETHLDFFIHPTLSYKIIEYRRWIDFLISQNKTRNIYPQKALENLLEHRWEIFFFKIAPMRIWKNIEYIRASKKIRLNQLIYLLKLKINSVFKK